MERGCPGLPDLPCPTPASPQSRCGEAVPHHHPSGYLPKLMTDPQPHPKDHRGIKNGEADMASACVPFPRNQGRTEVSSRADRILTAGTWGTPTSLKAAGLCVCGPNILALGHPGHSLRSPHRCTEVTELSSNWTCPAAQLFLPQGFLHFLPAPGVTQRPHGSFLSRLSLSCLRSFP